MISFEAISLGHRGPVKRTSFMCIAASSSDILRGKVGLGQVGLVCLAESLESQEGIGKA